MNWPYIATQCSIIQEEADTVISSQRINWINWQIAANWYQNWIWRRSEFKNDKLQYLYVISHHIWTQLNFNWNSYRIRFTLHFGMSCIPNILIFFKCFKRFSYLNEKTLVKWSNQKKKKNKIDNELYLQPFSHWNETYCYDIFLMYLVKP